MSRPLDCPAPDRHTPADVALAAHHEANARREAAMLALLLCYAVERLPASEWQTEMSLRASALHDALESPSRPVSAFGPVLGATRRADFPAEEERP